MPNQKTPDVRPGEASIDDDLDPEPTWDHLTREHFLRFNASVTFPAITNSCRKTGRNALADAICEMPDDHLYPTFRLLSGEALYSGDDVSEPYYAVPLGRMRNALAGDRMPEPLRRVFDRAIGVWYVEDGPDLELPRFWMDFVKDVTAVCGRWPGCGWLDNSYNDPVLAFIEHETGWFPLECLSPYCSECKFLSMLPVGSEPPLVHTRSDARSDLRRWGRY